MVAKRTVELGAQLLVQTRLWLGRLTGLALPHIQLSKTLAESRIFGNHRRKARPVLRFIQAGRGLQVGARNLLATVLDFSSYRSFSFSSLFLAHPGQGSTASLSWKVSLSL